MNNQLKTILLLGILSVLLIVIGSAFAGRDGLYFAFFFSLLINGISYFFSDRIALAVSSAQPIKKSEAPELYQMIKDLSQKASIPMPKIYKTPAKQANAFATGRDSSHASVAVTQGLMDLLSKEEVKAVLAHEIVHVKNKDILIASVAAVLASTIAFISRMGLYGGFGERRDRQRGGGLAVILAIFGPIAAMLVQFAISRQREYVADQKGAELIGDGKPLAKALVAIHDSVKHAPAMGMNPAFSSLYIDNPFGGAGGAFLNLFSTHPPVEERVKRLTESSNLARKK